MHYCHLGRGGGGCTIRFEVQAIIKSLLATVQGKQIILMQRHFQLSQNPFQPISELYLNLEIQVILVNVRGSWEYRTPEIRFSTKVVLSVFMQKNTTSPMGGAPGMMGEFKKVGGQSIGPYRFNTAPIYTD